jgi:hypothetical protein
VAEPVRSITPRTNKSDKGLPTLVTELWELVVGYLKQETVEPLKGLLRFVLFGVIGAFCVAIGFLILSLALLRALQTETGEHLTGNLSWVPYALTLVAVLGVAGLAGLRISAGQRKKGDR